jgi:hypothetical protein
MVFTKEQQDWLNCIAARVVPLVQGGMSVEQATTVAMDQHAAFLREMVVGTSDKAKAATKLLCAKVWHDANANALAKKTIDYVTA